jgi:hypothetical protein
VTIAGSGPDTGAALKALFTQLLTLCAGAGLVSLGRVALDRPKVRAAASRHRAMVYDPMVRAGQAGPPGWRCCWRMRTC